jgi:hypothetical protein
MQAERWRCELKETASGVRSGYIQLYIYTSMKYRPIPSYLRANIQIFIENLSLLSEC